MKRIIVLGLIGLSAVMQPVQASTVVLDQQSAGRSHRGYLALNIHTVVQNFTAGVSGTLASVSVLVSGEADVYEDLVLSIWSTRPDGLRQDLLGTFSMSADEISNVSWQPDYESFDVLSAGISIAEGDVLAIALDSAAVASTVAPDQRYIWWTTDPFNGSPVDYTGGISYWCNTTNVELCLPQDFDLGFRTYVQTVPIPAAVWLFGSGLLSLGWLRRLKEGKSNRQ